MVVAGGRRARLVFTDRRHGDLAVDGEPGALDRRRAGLAPVPWTWLRQVHGDRVVRVAAVGDASGAEADAAVTATSGATLAVHTADCAPVLLVDAAGAVGAVHAGWRGLLAGVVEATVDALRSVGGGTVTATIGPLIGPECYEFGADDLDPLVDRLGAQVRGETADGRPALDLRAGVEAGLRRAGVADLRHLDGCTACDPRWYSHRARADRGRQAALVWLEP